MGSILVTLLILVISIIEISTAENSTDYTKECEEQCRNCAVGAVGRGRCMGLCPTYSGRGNPCQPPRKINERLVKTILQVTIGCAIGVLLCIMFAVGGLLCVRMRHKRKDSLPKQSPKALKNFHKELDKFRPHAYTFLAILNNVRRQVREMHRAGNTDAAVICGRSLSDLAKILMLLNRRDVPVIPPDWPRLASWAERLLERTSLVSPPPQPQVAQLIQFLQTPSEKPQSSESDQSTMMSTLKPPAYEVSIRPQDSPAFGDFSFKPDWSQQWELSQETVQERPGIQHVDAWQSRQEVQQNNLWLDDDFYLISFRPQDEIVTVL